jgi:hypothetical protein
LYQEKRFKENMSVKKEYEIKTHTVTEEVLIKETRYCDVCQKEIKTHSYWELTTHHNDWGNDSCESYEYFDVCSKECLRQKFDEYVKKSDNKHNSEFFEVERI